MNNYTLIDGKVISEQIKTEIAEEVKQIIAAGGKQPHLAVIIVGHDGGSETYVANKVKSCAQVGIKSTKIAFEADVTEETLLAAIDKLLFSYLCQSIFRKIKSLKPLITGKM